MLKPSQDKLNGFTLIEVIIVIIISAILGSLMYQFTSTALTRSGIPILRTQDHLALTQAMNIIIGDYKLLLQQGNGWTTFCTRYGTSINPYQTNFELIANWINFDPVTGLETVGTQNDGILKLTIKHKREGQSVVVLFTN
ncbi:MAG: prepilin-type N-terminal cleavage/methylation domain-containing protein [Desulfobacterales bacterium]|nr:prepilin-type N-terminal cleavage/methylation domain-containing protein [Desulfobacterales bacterium]